ncbi:MAG: ribosome maturation factor RimM [Proteobacteria bacterium]|nr:ribosome maturation factor RimM [Pseudomonadota bacterium]
MTDDPVDDSPRVEIGGIARAHGIRGEVIVHTHDPESQILGSIERIYVDDVTYEIRTARDTTRGWLLVLVGIDTRNDAERLRGKVVEIDRALLELTDGDVLLDDLVGCAVRRADGLAWGEIVAVSPGEMQDLLIIHDGDIERMLPLVDVFVTNIDLDARVVTVDPPEGLPELRLVPATDDA